MRVSEIRVGSSQDVVFDVLDAVGDAIPAGAAVRYNPGQRRLYSGSRSWVVEPHGRRSARALEDVFRSGQSLWWVLRQDGSRLTIRVHHLPLEARPDRESITIGLDEASYDAIRQQTRQKGRTDAAVRSWFEDEFVVIPYDGGLPFVIYSQGGSLDTPFDDRAFRIYGRTYMADLRHDEWERLLVIRVTRLRPNDAVGVISARSFAIEDASIAAGFERLHGDARGFDYLDLWRSYNVAELNLLLRRARQIGSFAYHRCHQVSRGVWAFHLHLPQGHDAQERWSLIEEVEEAQVEIAATAPLYLRRHTPLGTVIQADVLKEQVIGARRFWSGDPSARVPDWDRGVVYVYNARERADALAPASEGFLYLSLRRDHTRIERRVRAMERLTTAQTPMPHLARLLNQDWVPSTRPRPLHAKRVLSPATAACFGNGTKPNARQIEALSAALRTTDIVLVQGPPGTGKTRLVAAIQTRLAELAESSALTSGQVLLTSYQHEAVDNAAARTEVYGLPAVKVGRRFGEEFKLSTQVAAWRDRMAEAMRSRLGDVPETPLSDAVRRLSVLVAVRKVGPGGAEQTRDLLQRARSAVEPFGGPDLIARYDVATGDVGTAGSEERACRLAVLAEALPEAAVSWGTGSRRAAAALQRAVLGDDLPLVERDALDEAAGWGESHPPPRFDDLAALRRRLTTGAAAPAPDPVLDLLEESLSRLRRMEKEDPSGARRALVEYLRALEREPEALEHALKQYTVTLAATCSQAGGHQMAAAKGQAEGEMGLSFDTVIVDEAARTNPLDLFVPLAYARERVVLIGDQNQLPQILEEDVEDEAQKGLEEGAAAAARQTRSGSLFGRMFDHFEALGARPGVVRCVRLNEQYRMHPALGDLISRTYYGGELRSPRPPEDFAHGLPGYAGASAAWIDVARARPAGDEEPRWSRRAEAVRIAQEMVRLLEAPESASLSFGVISFYKDQVRMIERALLENNVCVRGEDGTLLLDRAQRTDGFRVGTVDAFQGREFDVVFLSTVRSNDRARFGFLSLPNRLCVALSRQKRLLIAVGDGAMFDGAASAAITPGLRALRELSNHPTYGNRLV